MQHSTFLPKGISKFRLLSFFILFLMLGACSDLDNLDIEVVPLVLKAPVVLKLEEDPRFPVVLVSVNGKPDFRFVLDTGSTLTGLFMHEKARSLELQGTGNFFNPGGSGDGDKPKTQSIKGVDLAFGGLEFQGMAVLAFPASVSDNLALGKEYPIDGIIGYDLFSRYMVTFDSKAKTVTLSDQAIYASSRRSEVLPLKVNGSTAFSGGRMSFIDMLVEQENGAPFQANFHLDTGSSFLFSLIPGSNASVTNPTHAWPSSSRGTQGKTSVVWAASSTAHILRKRLDNIRTVYAPKGKSTKGDHGRVGHGFLKRFKYTVDYKGEQFIIEALEDSFKPYPTGYTGFLGHPHKEGMNVTSVKPLSPAEASGLKIGIYTHMNGQSMMGLNRDEMNKLLNVDAGTVLEVCRETDCYKIQAADVSKPPKVKP